MKTTKNILLAVCLALLLLHILGALELPQALWGTHLYAFYDTTILWIAIGCVLLLCIPVARDGFVRFLNGAAQKCAQLPTPILFVIIAVGIIVGGKIYAAQLHLLGDGALLLRSLSNADWNEKIVQSFNNQPLMYWIFRSTLNFHLIESQLETYNVYIWINGIAAVFFLGLIFWTVAKLKISPLEKALLGCVLFFGAGSQFFFGYIENYVLQYVTMAAYAITGWFALERRISVAVPIVCFCIAVSLHLGNLIFFPSLLALILFSFPENRKKTLMIMGGTGITGVVALAFVGYLPALLKHFSPESVDFLPLFTVSAGNFPYTMFSAAHLLDWFNLNMLIAPLGLAIAAIFYFALSREQRKRNFVLQFLIISALCGLTFTWVTNTALGMARDWDVLAGFFVPLMVLNLYLLSQAASAELRRYALVMITAVMIVHWIPWIGINANPERHLRRLEKIDNPSFLSPGAQMFADEALANFYFDNGRYADAQKYYEHFITIDPNNPRIIGNISDVYRHIGNKEKYFQMLLRAVAMKSRDPGVYSNLGVEYAGRGDTMKAIEFNERAVAMDSTMAKAHANLGLLYVSKKLYLPAQEHFIKAINLGMGDLILYKYAADLSFFLNDFTKAVEYYGRYLQMKPDDAKAKTMLERARQALR